MKNELLQAKKPRGASTLSDGGHGVLLVGHEVDRVAEEHGIHRGNNLGERGRVALHEAHVAPGEPLARHVDRLKRRLDAHDGRRAATPLQFVKDQLGDGAGA